MVNLVPYGQIAVKSSLELGISLGFLFVGKITRTVVPSWICKGEQSCQF